MCMLGTNDKILVLSAVAELTDTGMCFTAYNVWEKVKNLPLEMSSKQEVCAYVRELWNYHNEAFRGYAVTVSTIEGQPLHFFPIPPQIRDRQDQMEEAAVNGEVLRPRKLAYVEEEKKSATDNSA